MGKPKGYRGMKNSGFRRVPCYVSGRYFSVVTAAGVRSNILTLPCFYLRA